EGAVADGLISDGARMASGRWVRQVGREIRRSAVLLFEVGRIIVAYPKIQREPPRYLPTVLRIETPLLFSISHGGVGVNADRIHGAQQETGVGNTDVVGAEISGAGARGSIHHIRHGRLRAAESKISPAEVLRISAPVSQLTAELKGM